MPHRRGATEVRTRPAHRRPSAPSLNGLLSPAPWTSADRRPANSPMSRAGRRPGTANALHGNGLSVPLGKGAQYGRSTTRTGQPQPRTNTSPMPPAPWGRSLDNSRHAADGQVGGVSRGIRLSGARPAVNSPLHHVSSAYEYHVIARLYGHAGGSALKNGGQETADTQKWARGAHRLVRSRDSKPLRGCAGCPAKGTPVSRNGRAEAIQPPCARLTFRPPARTTEVPGR